MHLRHLLALLFYFSSERLARLNLVDCLVSKISESSVAIQGRCIALRIGLLMLNQSSYLLLEAVVFFTKLIIFFFYSKMMLYFLGLIAVTCLHFYSSDAFKLLLEALFLVSKRFKR